ncbi:MAG: cobaltochelatase subunit CobN, partial [Pseudomonadota bacterium]
PTRGRLDVLPTGRNFYSLDSRALPTPTAWTIGQRAADAFVARYLQDHGTWPTAIALSVWGTSNMRTGGDDLAQALALMGVRPVWEPASRRVTGFEIMTLAELGRPRVDVTLRISGFFRDAFPAQIALIDSAVRAVSAREDEGCENPIAAHAAAETARLIDKGADAETARRRATFRIYGAMPGAYGAGLQAMFDEDLWDDAHDLADAFLTWSGYAYGSETAGAADRDGLERRIKATDAVLHNQDNREHDILDSDDYYQFAGGLAVAGRALKGEAVPVYHGDHSRPERPVVRALEEEIARVVRGRAVNPKWIAAMRRHGYKGAFELAATVDYLTAFAATTGAVRDHHFDAVYDAYVADADVRGFIADANPDALADIAKRLQDAIDRGLWTPRRNSAYGDLSALRQQETVT